MDKRKLGRVAGPTQEWYGKNTTDQNNFVVAFSYSFMYRVK